MKSSKIFNYDSLLKNKLFFSSSMIFAIILCLSYSAKAGTRIGNHPLPQNEQGFIYISPDAIISGVDNIYRSENEVLIFVSDQTVLYGELNVSNVKISFNQIVVNIPKISVKHNLPLEIQQEYSVHINVKDKAIERLQVLLNQEVKNTFFISADTQEYFKWAEIILAKQITLSNSHSQNGTITFSRECDKDSVPLLIKEHKFYWTLCYLECSKLRNAVLRGPPTI